MEESVHIVGARSNSGRVGLDMVSGHACVDGGVARHRGSGCRWEGVVFRYS